jgi:cell division inhibitor SepF
MGISEKFKMLWGKVTGVEEVYIDDEENQTEGELALDNNRYENFDMAMRSSEKVMRFPDKAEQNLRLYKLKGQQWWDTATKACDDFNEGCSIMVNTEEANKDAVMRLVDFLTGVAYAQKGKLVKNGTTGFIVVPANCSIGGDIGDEVFEDVSSPYSSTSIF